MIPGRFRLLVLAVAAFPSAGSAFEWSGRAGVNYSRDDTQLPSSPKVTTPRLEVDLALDASGIVYQEDALQWNGGVSYRRLSLGVTDAPDEVQDQLEYRLRATAFPHRNSPITLSGFALRANGDGSGGAGSYGSTTDSYGATFALRLPERPGLEVNYAHTDSTLDHTTLPDSRTTRDQFGAATGHSTKMYSYRVSYQGTNSDGTYAGENFDDHRANVYARVRLAERVSLALTDGFYRRVPTLDSPFNPRQDVNGFSAVLRKETAPGADLQSQSLTYRYSSGVTDSSAGPLSRNSQQLELLDERALRGPEWSLTTQVVANLDDRAVGDDRELTAGQALIETVTWRRQTASEIRLQIYGGPSIGLVEPFDGSVDVGWGTTGGVSAQRAWSAVTGSAQYAISYSTRLGTAATSLSQQGSVNAERPISAGLGRLRLLFSGDRLNDPLFGSRASRALTLRGEYQARSWTAWADADMRDGVASPLSSPISGDGIFLAPDYDARTRTIAAGGSVLVARLLAAGNVRLTNSDLPDRPAQDDLELRGSITWRIAAISIALEDRYVVGLGGGEQARTNVVYLRAYRLFGSGR